MKTKFYSPAAPSVKVKAVREVASTRKTSEAAKTSLDDETVTIVADIGGVHGYSGKLKDRISLDHLPRQGSGGVKILVYSSLKPRYVGLMSGDLPVAIERFEPVTQEESASNNSGKKDKPAYIAKFNLPKLVLHSFNELWDGKMVFEYEDRRVLQVSLNRDTRNRLGRRGNPENIKNHLDAAGVRTGLDGEPVLQVEGWALHISSLQPVTAELFLDGIRVQSTVCNRMRPDVLESYEIKTPLTPGFILQHKIVGARPKSISIQFRNETDCEAIRFPFEKVPGATNFMALDETFFDEGVIDAPFRLPGGLRKFYVSKDKAVAAGLSIIIPTRLSTDNIFPLVESLRKAGPLDEIIVIGHEVAGDARSKLRSIADIYINVSGRFNWSKFNNHAAAKATKPILLFLNDDVFPVSPNWRTQLLTTLQASGRIGALGARLVGKDLRFQHDGIELYGKFTHHVNLGETEIADEQPEILGPLDGVTGAFLATPAQVFHQIGRFDESLDIIGNDLEYCIRLGSQGYFSAIPRDLYFFHAEGSSRSNMRDNEISEILDERLPVAGRLRILDQGRTLDRQGERVLINIRKKVEIKKLLLIKVDHIGDFYSSLESVSILRSAMPMAHCTLVCSPEVAELAKKMSQFDEVLPFRVFNKLSGKGKEPTREIPKSLLNQNYDVAIDLRKHADARHLITKVSATYKFAFREKVPLSKQGFIYFHGFEETKDVHFSPSISHELNAFARFINNYLGSVPVEISLDEVRAAQRKNLIGKRRVAVFPLSGSATRAYPISLYMQFAILHKTLHPEDQIDLILPSDQASQHLDLDKINLLKRSKIGVVTPTILTKVEEIIKASDLVVTNNTGPMWMAAANKVPCIAIFSGVVSPTHWLPEDTYQLVRNVGCSPCHIAQSDQCHRNLFCLNSIDPSYISLLARYIAVSRSKHTH